MPLHTRLKFSNKGADYTIRMYRLMMYLKKYVHRPTLKIFLFSLTLPCFTNMGQSVRKLFLFNFLNWIPITVKPVLRGHSTKDKKLLFFQD